MTIQYQQSAFGAKQTILNDDKFRLYGNPIEGNQNGRVPTLYVDTKNNNPRIMVRLNNGKQGEEGKLELNLDLPTLSALLVMMEDAIRSKQPIVQRVEVKKTGWDRQANKPRDPYTYASIFIGKDADGLEFIGVQHKQLKLTFHFTEAEFHPFIDTSTGQPATRQYVSNILARAWVKIMSQIVPMILAHVWDYGNTPEAARAKRQQQNGQGGNNGGYNNNQNNYSNNNNNYNGNNQSYSQNRNQQQSQPAQQSATQPEAPLDNFDDIPF